jgi:hypothetical protein
MAIKNSGNPNRPMGLKRGGITPKGVNNRNIDFNLYQLPIFEEETRATRDVNALPWWSEKVLFKYSQNQEE